MNETKTATDTEVSFTPAEIDYINSQRLVRIATASNSGAVDVAPIGLHFNGKTFLVAGIDIPHTLKIQEHQGERARRDGC